MASSYLQGPAWIRGMLRALGRLPLQSRTTIHRSESQNSCYDLSRNDNSATSEWAITEKEPRGYVATLRAPDIYSKCGLHYTPHEQAIQRHMGVYLTATLDYRVPICSATSNASTPKSLPTYVATLRTLKAVHSRTQQQSDNTKQSSFLLRVAI